MDVREDPKASIGPRRKETNLPPIVQSAVSAGGKPGTIANFLVKAVIFHSRDKMASARVEFYACIYLSKPCWTSGSLIVNKHIQVIIPDYYTCIEKCIFLEWQMVLFSFCLVLRALGLLPSLEFQCHGKLISISNFYSSVRIPFL